MNVWRGRLVFAGLALAIAFALTRGLIQGPHFTDAYYHLNAANRLVTGQGLTDTYLWTYIGAPAGDLPTPSHLYWMPLTSLSAAAGMWLLSAPENYVAAQLPFTLMFWGTALVAFALGERLGGNRRHAWLAGLLTLFSGFFVRFWGAIDTFAPYALFGSLALLLLGLTVDPGAGGRRRLLTAAGAGALAAAGHLTRADGLLLLLAGWAALLWPVVLLRASRRLALQLTAAGIVMTIAYGLTMLPWFLRNQSLIGAPLPLGGAQAVWLTVYDDMFRYPPLNTPERLLGDGLGLLLSTRWEAVQNNIGTFVAVEGLVVMTPLMLIGLWRRRRLPFLRTFWIYALGMHVAMTFIFPFPGYRGGLFHSAAALVPWWAVLGVLGLDDVIDWLAQRRRQWNARLARLVYPGILLGAAALLTMVVAVAPGRVGPSATPPLVAAVDEMLPPDARLLVNDPAQWYFYTGRSSVVLPNEAPQVLLDIARAYDIDYLVIEQVSADGRSSNALTEPLQTLLTALPDFLTPIPLEFPDARLYKIRR